MSFKVLNPKPLAPAAEQLLEEAGIQVIRGSGRDKDALLRDIAEADAAVVWLAPRFDREVIDAGKRLKLLARYGVGMEMIDADYARSRGIIVCNTPDTSSNAVAEHAMFLMMSCARNAHYVDARIHAGQFGSILQRHSTELEGGTLGIVGPGRIATLLAKKAKYGFGMRVLAYQPHPGSRVPEDMERVSSLDELLERSDFLSLHAPETPETVGMLGMDELKKMKPSAFLINTARGRLVDEDALVRALREGVIRGAGLDVFVQEPLPAGHPLLSLDNVVLTPHYAMLTERAVINTGMAVAESILAVCRGERPRYELRGS